MEASQFKHINCCCLKGSRTIPPVSGWYESSEEKQLPLFLSLSEHMEKLEPPHSLPARAPWELASASILSGSCSEMVLSLRASLTDVTPIIFPDGLPVTGFSSFFFLKKKEDTNITDVVEELGPCLAPSPRRVPLLLCVRQFLIIHSTINMLCVKQVRLASV